MISRDQHSSIMVSPLIIVYAVSVFYVSSGIASPRVALSIGKQPSRSAGRPNARSTLYHSGNLYFPDTRKVPMTGHPGSLFPNPYRLPNLNSRLRSNKGHSTLKTKTRNLKRIPLVVRHTTYEPVLFPDADSLSGNEHGPEANAVFDGEGIEQRMLLPRGYSIPDEMYGPNYIWDTKGWPRRRKTTPKPIDNNVKYPTGRKLYYDSPIIFRDNPVAIFATTTQSTHEHANRL